MIGMQKSVTKLFLCFLLVPVIIGLVGCNEEEGGPPPTPGLGMTPARLPLAVVNQSYSSSLRAIAGSAGCSYAWTTSGQLPPGLAYSSPAHDILAISGTPTTPGVYTVNIRVVSCGERVEETRTIAVVNSLDLSGNWSFNVTVTAAGGDCTSEIGTQSTRTITITQSATGSPDIFNITMDGFVGVQGNILTGQLTNWHDVNVSGSYPEEGGTTTSSHSLFVYTANEMGGVEQWSWTGAGNCPGGRATVTATR